MKKILLALLFGISFIPLFSQTTTYTGSLLNTDPFFTRPNEGEPPTSLSAYTNVFYKVVPIVIGTPLLMDVNTTSTWDNFVVLYGPGGFTPASPLMNALVANDDLGYNSNSSFTHDFSTAGTYYLVVCSFKSNVTGSYSIATKPTTVLPIKLNSFTALKAGVNSILVNWSSANESNLHAYQVQRSIDGNNFIDLINGSIAAKNNSTNTGYKFIDDNPGAGINYYRLKMTETTGQVSYGSVVLVKNGKLGISNVRVFPNPTSDYLQVEVNALQNNKAVISVIGSDGAVLVKGEYSFNNQAILSVDIKKIPAGKYFLKTVIDKVVSTAVFIKN